MCQGRGSTRIRLMILTISVIEKARSGTGAQALAHWCWQDRARASIMIAYVTLPLGVASSSLQSRRAARRVFHAASQTSTSTHTHTHTHPHTRTRTAEGEVEL